MDACHHQKKNLILYVYGELEASAGKQLEDHLEVCETCRHERQRLLSLLGKLRETADTPALSPPEIRSLVSNIKWNLKNQQKKNWWQRYLDYRPSRMIPAVAMACILIIIAGIVGYVKINETHELQTFAKHQNEESMLSDKDLEIIKNLDLLKDMDAIQKLSQVVDLKGDINSQGEMDNDTRGMRQDAYRKYYA